MLTHGGGKAQDIELDLSHRARLFGGNGVDPFDPDYNCATGMDRLIAAVSARRAPERGAGRIVLRFRTGADDGPPGAIGAAIGRFCGSQADDLDRKARAKGREGVQTAWLSAAVVVVALCLSALAKTSAGLPPMVQTMLGNGLVIAGWVALWRPIDLLLYEPWLLRREAQILRVIAGMKITVTTG